MTATDIVTEDQLVPPDATVVHPPYGFVQLRKSVASDLEVVNAARVSFHKQSEWGELLPDDDIDALGNKVQEPTPGGGLVKMSDGDAGVLRFLALNAHGTPFEHTYFQFLVRAPIFLFREWHRHRIGISINEESARYVELRPDFYVPDADHVRVQVGKPGHYRFEPASDELASEWQRNCIDSYRSSYAAYQWAIEQGIAKEVARTVLPVGIYSTMLWVCNARSLMNFLQLRNAPKALRELREYAAAMESIFAQKMPLTAEFFNEAGRIAP